MLCLRTLIFLLFFFFNDTATTEIYTLSLHDALPISATHRHTSISRLTRRAAASGTASVTARAPMSFNRRGSPRRARRSEEHTSELQSRLHLVCRLLLEKKKRLLFLDIIRCRQVLQLI